MTDIISTADVATVKLAAHLERFGSRDGLSVAWSR
jgi:hypothetical protein